MTATENERMSARRCALLTAALGFALLDTRGKPALPGGELGGSSILNAP